MLSVSHITGVTPRSEKNVTMFMAESNVGHKRCREKDLVINTMWAWMGALGVSRYSGLVSPSYGVYRPLSDKTDPLFLDALLRTSTYVGEYTTRSTGINSSRLRLYPERFLSLPVLLPPLSEQIRISSFIRRSSAQIQKLIRANRRVIGLLNEQRQVAIHRAVTRGLDLNVCLKPSGIKWIGDIPHHWESVALRLRYSVELGKMLDAKRITGECLTPYLRNTDVQWDRINVDDLPQMDIPIKEYGRYTVRAGDLLVCEGGDVGRCAFWTSGSIVCGYQKALHRVRPNDVTKDCPRYLFYLMFAASKCGVFVADGSENTIAHLTSEKLRAHRFPFPAYSEQTEIAAFLDSVTRTSDGRIKRVRNEIDLLREYRARLIADVVTGKLDVRGVELPELDDAEEVSDVEGEELEDSEELEAVEESADAD